MIIGFVLLGIAAQAQILKPVKWSFSAVPLKGKTGMYEVHMTTTIENGWKIYSQTTPDGGPLPTKITFAKNPLVLLGGKVKEVGELHKMSEPAFGVDVFYFSNKVDFVQIVKLKKPGQKTSLSGTVVFMVCDENQCLPPDELEFNIPLN